MYMSNNSMQEIIRNSSTFMLPKAWFYVKNENNSWWSKYNKTEIYTGNRKKRTLEERRKTHYPLKLEKNEANFVHIFNYFLL